MLISRIGLLSIVLTLFTLNSVLAQSTTDNSTRNSDISTRYWKNSKSTKGRLAYRPFQSDDENDDEFATDDEPAPDFASEDDDYQRATFVWPAESIQEIRIAPKIKLKKQPEDRSYMLSQKFSRNWHQYATTCKNYRWQSPGISYQPLYFEDVELERYGQCRPGFRQAFRSSAHFFTSFMLLPFHLHREPIYSCEYPLGYCRPGNCAPVTRSKQFWW